MSREVIDGPVEDLELDAPDLAFMALGRIVVNNMRDYGSLPSVPLGRERAPGPFRLTSLVEVPGSKLGYALAISEAVGMESFNTDFPVASAVFFTVDRETHEVVDEPKRIDHTIAASGPDQDYEKEIEEIVSNFDRDELLKLVFMLDKATLPGTKKDEAMDKDVELALMNSHLSLLAEMFPRISSPEEPTQAHPCEDPEFLSAVTERINQSGPEEGYSELCLQKEIKGELYAVEICHLKDFVDTVYLAVTGRRPRIAIYTHPEGINAEATREETQTVNLEHQSNFPEPSILIEVLAKGAVISGKLFTSHYHEANAAQFDEET